VIGIYFHLPGNRGSLMVNPLSCAFNGNVKDNHIKNKPFFLIIFYFSQLNKSFYL